MVLIYIINNESDRFDKKKYTKLNKKSKKTMAILGQLTINAWKLKIGGKQIKRQKWVENGKKQLQNEIKYPYFLLMIQYLSK